MERRRGTNHEDGDATPTSEAASEPAPPPPEFPSPARWKYRAGYATAVAVLVTSVFLLPGSPLMSDRKSERIESHVVFLTLVCSAALLYAWVQSSDPGYLSLDVMPEGGDALLDEEAGVEMISRSSPRSDDALGVSAGVRPDRALRVAMGDGSAEDDDHDGGARRGYVGGEAERRPSDDDDDEEGEEKAGAEGPREEDDVDAVAAGQGQPCEECGIVPPVRAHHCRACRRCVACFDHHCYVIGTCVGERNHCRFWWFIFLQWCSVWSGISIVSRAMHSRSTFEEWAQENQRAIFTSVALWIVFLYLSILVGFQTWLMLTNMTTYECIKGPEGLWYLRDTEDMDLPYSEGLVRNLMGFCCIRDGWRFAFTKRRRWTPTPFKPPGRIDRDSADVCAHPWQNKYYSCC